MIKFITFDSKLVGETIVKQHCILSATGTLAAGLKLRILRLFINNQIFRLNYTNIKMSVI